MMRIASLTLVCAFLVLAGCGGATPAGAISPDAPADSPSSDSTSACPASLVGQQCQGGASCGDGLVCDYTKDRTSMTCLKRAGICCERSAECMSDDCHAGTCAPSPLDFPCESTSDCVLGSGEPYGRDGVFCYNAPRGLCCPKNAGGGPPGCPNA
jgi:hypothetical protein